MATFQTIRDKLSVALADANAVPEPTVAAKLQTSIDEVDTATGGGPLTPVTPTKKVLDLANLVLFSKIYPGDRYRRMDTHILFPTTAISIQFQRISMAGGGARLPFTYPKYGLLFNGVERATYTRSAAGTEIIGTFTGNLGGEADGVYLTEIVAYDAAGKRVATPTECYVPVYAWVDRNGQAKDSPWVAFQNGTFDWERSGADDGVSWIALVPKAAVRAQIEPETFNYIPTVNADPINAAFPGVFYGGEPFNTAIPKEQITRLNFTISTDEAQNNIKRPSITKRGITVTETKQGYFIADGIATVPQLPQLDGPRGVGQVYFPSAFWASHAGSVYFCDTFSFGKVSFDGSVRRFAGLRHKQNPYWEDTSNQYGGGMYGKTDPLAAPQIEVVGDWDPSIPMNRRFPWESWGIVVDLRSTHQDPTLPLRDVPPFGMLQQHLGEGPRFFIVDRFGRILLAQFHKARPGDPPTITEWATGLSDPWSITSDQNGKLYVTERTAHRISVWSADTPQTKLGDVLTNPNGNLRGALNTTRYWSFPTSYYSPAPYTTNNPNLTLPRADPIVAPEGISYQDGYIYFASYAQGDVRRVKLGANGITPAGPVEICARPFVAFNSKSKFVYIALSDGTFGPRGTIFTTTWSENYYGRPEAFPPLAGVAADGTPLTHSMRWDYANYGPDVINGPGGRTSSSAYAAACAVSNGMLFTGSTQPGIDVFVKATLGEALPNYARAKAGHLWYRQNGYRLLCGNFGFGFVDRAVAPLPWGKNADCDYWLQLTGHIKP